MYRPGQYISWSDFKRCPQETQREILEFFAAEFGCTNKALGEMMGVTGAAIYLYLKKYRPELLGILPRQMSDRKKARFAQWLEEQRGAPAAEDLPASADGEGCCGEAPSRILQRGELSLEGSAAEIGSEILRVFQDKRLAVHLQFEILPPWE